MKEQIEQIKAIASKLPTGLIDPEALNKAYKEETELREMIASGDELGAIMEAGDCIYYVIKAEANRLVTVQHLVEYIYSYSARVGLSTEVLLNCIIAKMSLRAKPDNPKNDKKERLAVQLVLPLPYQF